VFTLDPKLEADTAPVCDLELCAVRLMDDARFAWLVLVPRRPGLVEITDLSEPERMQLMKEITLASDALCAVAPCDKLNIGALGNIVRQLHIHIVARVEGDAAWPDPVWGSGAAKPYDENWMRSLIGALRTSLSP
jgi:diadenosine tetraphosphate (Ap4A) HIT family hydrolase